ncbi:MAG: hypothetical protein NTZ68_02225 [Candidatus Dependentiae bacterium]|nr:hypothetical protein [Candidatus Dependentiae bacterium]
MNFFKLLAFMLCGYFQPCLSAATADRLSSGGKTLSKQQMLEFIHKHENLDRNFSGQDADETVLQLSKKPLSTIRDRFIEYQQKFVTNDITRDKPEEQKKRLLQFQKQFEQEQKNRSLLRKIPAVHNTIDTLSALLPSSLATWPDQELYAKIAARLKGLGFAHQDIVEEIGLLKQATSADLQNQYPHLKEQLTKQLHYFSTAEHQQSNTIKMLDSLLKNIHTWGSTVASVAASGGSTTAALALGPIASTLTDPNITLSNGMTKREFLEMIYIQYAQFDASKHTYINPEYQESELLTKKEFLDKIHERLRELDIAPSKTREAKYSKLPKKDLENLYSDFKNSPTLLPKEKHILFLSKAELLKQVELNLKNLKIPKNTIKQELAQLEQKDIRLIRTAYVDSNAELTQRPMKAGILPDISSTKEHLLLLAHPKIMPQAAHDYLSSSLRTDLESKGKSPAYIHWKMGALQDHYAYKQRTPDQLDTAIDLASKASQMRSTFGSEITSRAAQMYSLRLHHSLIHSDPHIMPALRAEDSRPIGL